MRRKAGGRGQNARDTANAIEQVLYQHSDRAALLRDRQNGAINLHTKQWQMQLKDGLLTLTAFDDNREIIKEVKAASCHQIVTPI